MLMERVSQQECCVRVILSGEIMLLMISSNSWLCFRDKAIAVQPLSLRIPHFEPPYVTMTVQANWNLNKGNVLFGHNNGRIDVMPV